MRSLTFVVLSLLVVGCGSSDDAPPSDAGPPPLDAPRRVDAFVPTDAGPRCSPASALPEPLACNGHPELCDRTYDAVSFPTTHNAMSSEEEEQRWFAPNQGRHLWHQLEDGVRGFMLDFYQPDPEGPLLLCHGTCALGQRPIAAALHDLKEFMDCHPAEVLSIIFEPHAGEAPLAAAFEEAGLLEYVHVQPEDAPWPTLREMIESGRRLVVFTETANRTLPWYHHAYDYVWDNDYSAQSPDDFDCEVLRGSRENAVFVLNHFITDPVASRTRSEEVNYEILREHVERCQRETERLPNLVTVDFYDASDLFEIVDDLNGF